MSVPQLADRMSTWLQNDYQAVLFEDDRGAAGYALFKREPEWVYLRQLFVKAERRRQGIATAAMAWLSDNVWKDTPRVRLDVLVDNAAGIALWRSLGFVDYCITMEMAIEPRAV